MLRFIEKGSPLFVCTIRCVFNSICMREFGGRLCAGSYPFYENVRLSHSFGTVAYYKTPFHLVTPSPWPLLASFSVLVLLFGVVKYMHGFVGVALVVKAGLLLMFFTSLRWWGDIIYEGFIQGVHTSVVQMGLKFGFVLFIFSEVMFFAAFFWAFFHSSLSPTLEVGGGWPPVRHSLVSTVGNSTFIGYGASHLIVIGLGLFNPWYIPFFNTLLLLISGSWLTHIHAVLQYRFFNLGVRRCLVPVEFMLPGGRFQLRIADH